MRNVGCGNLALLSGSDEAMQSCSPRIRASFGVSIGVLAGVLAVLAFEASGQGLQQCEGPCCKQLGCVGKVVTTSAGTFVLCNHFDRATANPTFMQPGGCTERDKRFRPKATKATVQVRFCPNCDLKCKNTGELQETFGCIFSTTPENNDPETGELMCSDPQESVFEICAAPEAYDKGKGGDKGKGK
jgi:hypothetical protein